MIALVIVASFYRRLMLVVILVMLQNQALPQMLCSLALQMAYLSLILYAPFFRERGSEIT